MRQLPASRSVLKAVLSRPSEDTTEEVVLSSRDPECHSDDKPFRFVYDSLVPPPQLAPRGPVQILGLYEVRGP
jgi:hypothetical protein